MINLTLVQNTIDKEVRNKSVISLLVLSIGLMIIAHFLAIGVKEWVNETNLNTLIANSSQNVILFFIALISNIVAVVIASSVFRSDFSSKIVAQILTFPISRFNYLISRILGAWILTILFYLICLSVGLLSFALSGSIKFDLFALFSSFVFMSAQLLALIIMSCFFSFFGNRIATFIVTFLYYLLAKVSFLHFNQEAFSFSDISFIKIVSAITYYLTPRVGELSFISDGFIAEKTFEAAQIGSAFLHFFTISILWIFVMKYFFDRREV